LNNGTVLRVQSELCLRAFGVISPLQQISGGPGCAYWKQGDQDRIYKPRIFTLKTGYFAPKIFFRRKKRV